MPPFEAIGHVATWTRHDGSRPPHGRPAGPRHGRPRRHRPAAL